MNKPSLHQLIGGAGRQHFGDPRFTGYIDHCGDCDQALAFYQWNVEAAGAMWETIGHLEVILRNRVADRLGQRHQRLGRAGSWLDDPMRELDYKAGQEIAKARQRVQRKGKPISDGQLMAELGFGFWRYLFARRYTSTLWPDIVGAFPNSPNRRRDTVEAPVVRLHEFRNRLAHHERIWNQPLADLHDDALTLIGFMDLDLADWIAGQSRVPRLLATCPQPRPFG